MTKSTRNNVPSTMTDAAIAAARTAMERVQELRTQPYEMDHEHARVYQMALFPADKRAMPLDFVACALFAAVHTKHAPYLRGERIVSINGYNITFTGKRLTQVHADVLMGVAALASEQPQGYIARIELRRFLRLIGREIGTNSRKSLRQLLDDLIASAIRITDPSGTVSHSGAILARAADQGQDNESVFLVEITREFCKLFQRGFALVDWQQRVRLKNKPLALWLQLYLSQFHKPIAVKEVHRLCGSGDELRFFRRRLKRELDGLEAVSAIAQWFIDEDDVLHVAPVGKPLPARFRPKREPQETARAEQAPLPLPELPAISERALGQFRALYPDHDAQQCLSAFRAWSGSQKARMPDQAFLGFAKKWVTP
jgi:hypothetical protein